MQRPAQSKNSLAVRTISWASCVVKLTDHRQMQGSRSWHPLETVPAEGSKLGDDPLQDDAEEEGAQGTTLFDSLVQQDWWGAAGSRPGGVDCVVVDVATD